MTILANAGVPMLMLVLPVMVFALVPIILIEGAVLRAREGGSFWRGTLHSGIANTASTIVGVPLTWIVLLVIQLGVDPRLPEAPGIWDAFRWMAWMSPGEGDPPWLIPAAALMLQAPFVLASCLIEWLVLAAFRRDVKRGRLLVTAALGNAATYALLALFWAWWILFPLE